MKRILLVALLSIFFCCGIYASDWKILHEKADSMTLNQAKKGVEKNPDSLEDLYVLGLVYLNEYNTEEAEKVFRKMLEMDLSSIEAQWGVAECLRRKYQCDICIRVLDEIIASHPEFAPAYISLSYIKYMKMDFNGSARLAYRVIKLGKHRVDMTNLVRAYGLLAGSKGMIAHYGGPISKVINGRVVMPYLKKAQKLQHDSAAVLYGLGSYYLLIPPAFGRNPDKALEYLEKAIEADPKFADIYVRLAQVYLLKGDEDKYNFYIEKSLRIDPKNVIALDIKEGRCKFICVFPRDE